MEIIKKTVLQTVTTGQTQGYWNAATNIPNITGATDIGYMWNVSVSGNTALGDIYEWYVGDWVVKTANGWGKVINGISGSIGKILIIPNLNINYNFKIGVTSVVKDIGFFDAFVGGSYPYPYPYYGESEPIGLANLY